MQTRLLDVGGGLSRLSLQTIAISQFLQLDVDLNPREPKSVTRRHVVSGFVK